MTEQQQAQLQREQPIVFAQLAAQALPEWVFESCRGKYILDAGCSTGHGTVRFATLVGASLITGVDNIEWHIDAARESFPRYEWLYRDAFAGDFRSRAQVLYCSNTLEHFDAPWILLHNLLVGMPDLETVILVLPYRERHPLVEGHKVSFSFADNNIPWGFTFKAIGQTQTTVLYLVSVAIKNLNSTGMWGGEQIVLAYHKHT